MTRTVADAAALLGAMSGADPDDPATQAEAGASRQGRQVAYDGTRSGSATA